MRCKNCGTEFDANFCPMCGQKANVGRVGWDTVRQGILLVWGMDSRSLSYTLLQLIGRPGYLIRDYISGKRQVSFPPVKMLLIIALVYLLVQYLTEAPTLSTEDLQDDLILLDAMDLWLEKDPGWALMANLALLWLPTWLLFCFAPRYPKHTLPEGLFIPVFMASLLLIIAIIAEFTTEWIGYLIPAYLIPIYYVIAYRQLFGYGWWGTIWRLAIVLIEGIVIMVTIAFAYEYVVTGTAISPNRTLGRELLVHAVFHIANASVLAAAYYISKRRCKNTSSLQTGHREDCYISVT